MLEEKEREEVGASLKGYKEKVATLTKGTIQWDKDLIFIGRTQRGYEIEFDPKVEWGCMPTESLLLSLGGCMGIDIVLILQKMKCQLNNFKIDIEGERNPTPPQYYKSIKMIVYINGDGITEKKVQRAISLSQEKYCSVYHSLRKDLDLTIEYKINEK